MSLEQLLEVTIVGASKYEQSQGDVAAAVSVITRQEIRAFGWRTLEQALASLPGVHTTYDRQYSYVGMRGFGLPGDYNTRLLVTINGNRSNDVVYDQAYVGRDFPLDLDLVERIEFIPGPGGAVYGQNAMFGVVNVVTRQGAELGGAEAALTTQHPQRLREGRASWGRRLPNGLDVLLSVSAMRARGEDRAVDFGAAGVSGVAAGLDGERDHEVFVRLAFGAWSFDLMHGDRRKDDPLGTNQSDPLLAGQYQADRFSLTQLQYHSAFAGGKTQWTARLFAGQENFHGRFSFGSWFGGATTSAWQGGEVRLLCDAVAGHRLMAGVEAQDNTRASQTVRELANPANDVSVQSPGYRVGLYAQDEWRMAAALTATLGLRVDRNDRTGTQASPRAALIWQALSTTSVKALYGRAHRAPNAFERDYADGVSQAANTSLQGEHIDTIELVADHRIGRDLTLRGSVYQWTMHGLVTQGVDPASGQAQYQSGDTVKARGMEFSADRTWAGGARLRGSVSVQDAAYESGAALLNSPRLLGKLNLSTPLPWAGLHAAYELRYDGRRRTLDGSSVGGHALSNLALRADGPAEGLSLSLSIANLFGKRYALPGSTANWQNALEQDGRSARLTLDWRI